MSFYYENNQNIQNSECEFGKIAIHLIQKVNNDIIYFTINLVLWGIVRSSKKISSLAWKTW